MAKITHLFDLNPHLKPRDMVQFCKVLYILVIWRKIQFIHPGGVVVKSQYPTRGGRSENSMVLWCGGGGVEEGRSIGTKFFYKDFLHRF